MLLSVPATPKPSSPIVKCFFHKPTSTCTYIIQDPSSKHAAIIDSVLDYHLSGARLSTEFADLLLSHIKEESLLIDWILDTHVHADHISGSNYLKKHLPQSRTAISEKITAVQKTWSKIFNWPDFPCDGSQWDYLLNETEPLKIGQLELYAIHTPGHTPACCTFVVGDTIFTGDVIFQPDFGTARCDFPGGSASTLYKSLKEKLYTLPDEYRIFVGHDYPPATRTVLFETSIASEKTSNKYVTENTTLEEFVTAREKRDAELDVPNLLFPSLQFNINAGALPAAEDNGTIYVKFPLKVAPNL